MNTAAGKAVAQNVGSKGSSIPGEVAVAHTVHACAYASCIDMPCSFIVQSFCSYAVGSGWCTELTIHCLMKGLFVLWFVLT